MKHLKLFNDTTSYEAFKGSSDFVLPNVSHVTNQRQTLYHELKKEKPIVLKAKYNATSDNLVAFTGASNIKSLKVNGTSIKIEPIKNENITFDVLGENISVDMETGEVATLPESYLLKSPASSWSFKAKDPNYVINENTFVCMLGMDDGMALVDPVPLADVMGYAFTTNDGVTLEVVDTFLNETNIDIQYGMQIGFTLADLDMNSGTLVFIDTEHQTNMTTGGLSTYSFDNEGSYDVEIKLADPDTKDMKFTETSLISIEIGDGITSIGRGIFSSCENLTSIVIPDSVTSIKDYTFYNCSSLSWITIPDSVTSIGESAFQNCSNLTSVNTGSGVTTIDNYAFYSCSSLTSIEIPNSVTSIGNCVFQNCTNLKSVAISNSVTSLGDYAFCNCSNLTSIVIPNSVKTIGNEVFSRCSALVDVTIGDSVTSIGNYAFCKCSSLSWITIPDSVTSIGESAFESSGLTGVLIGSGVTTIGKKAFYSCSRLSGKVVIPNSVTSLGDYAFCNCSSLLTIVISASITSISYYTFGNCKNLTSVTIPDSVTTIGDYAFYGCSGLKSIFMFKVTSIGNYAFCNCSSLTSVTIPNSVTTIGDYAFNICSSLSSIEIPDSVTSIGTYTFRNCSNLKSITCLAPTAPSITSVTFYQAPNGGTLKVPTGSDYSSWMSLNNYYLGCYSWTIRYI